MVVGECAKTGARTKKREGGRGGGKGRKGRIASGIFLKCACVIVVVVPVRKLFHRLPKVSKSSRY